MELFIKVFSVTFELGFWAYLIGLWLFTGLGALCKRSWGWLILNNLALLHIIFWILIINDVLPLKN